MVHNKQQPVGSILWRANVLCISVHVEDLGDSLKDYATKIVTSRYSGTLNRRPPGWTGFCTSIEVLPVWLRYDFIKISHRVAHLGLCCLYLV